MDENKQVKSRTYNKQTSDEEQLNKEHKQTIQQIFSSTTFSFSIISKDIKSNCSF